MSANGQIKVLREAGGPVVLKCLITICSLIKGSMLGQVCGNPFKMQLQTVLYQPTHGINSVSQDTLVCKKSEL